MQKKSRFLVILTLALILPVTMMMLIAMSGANNNVPARPEGPGDIFTAAGTPCVTAHSTTRALYASYNGPLYQVKRKSDGKTLNIGVVQPSEGNSGGYADAAAQDAFCANTVCWITTIYDQSGHKNHLFQAPPGTFVGPAKGGFNTLPIADMAPITIMGHKAYGTYIMPGMGLRNNDATGLAINDEPQGIYTVVDGKHFDSGCCFNYGNTSANSRAVGRGTMSTVYFGTSTVWGSGSGTGPWIMSDMEAGLFSGYDARQNVANPTIDSWRFVTGIVSGGGGNQWEIHGGNAQEGDLETYYKGVRPGSRENSYYYPMHLKGAVQLGNGGDNGNGSAGTFYEGIITFGYPTEAALNEVQANIVKAKYDVPRVNLSRVTTFKPQSSQEVTLTFNNTTGTSINDVKLSVILPTGWTSMVAGINEKSKTFSETIAPGATVKATFKITSSEITNAGYLTGKAEWTKQMDSKVQSETIAQRVRNVLPVKINEVSLGSGNNPANQFIELYNASNNVVDISNWTLINTRSEWAPVKLATIPGGTKLAAKGFYLLGLANSGLATSANQGTTVINVLDTAGFEIGQQINVDGEMCKIKNIGTPATDMTTIFVPVSTGPWLTIPIGSTNLPVTNSNGFNVGEKIGIDIGGNYEEATITAVGKAATLTNLSVEAKAGDTNIKVTANSNMTVGDMLTIGTGGRKELVKIKRIINIVSAPVRRGFGQGSANNIPGEVELTTPLKFDHMLDVDISDAGTGISFSPATHFEHKSGDAVQALGSGITLESALVKNHEAGAAVLNPKVTSGYKGSVTPNQWYGATLSTSAGSVVLMDASGSAVVDAIVYGSQQSNSSANGTITSPEIATLEGDQSQGGCIAVAPGAGRGSRFSSSTSQPDRSLGRFPDGADTDSNCNDFLLQNSITLLAPSTAGSNNIKVASVADFIVGQKIIIGTGTNSESAVIKTIGTAGGTTVGTATAVGTTVIPVFNVEGFNAGQTITIDNGASYETAVVASVVAGRRRFGNVGSSSPTDSITVTMPLKYAHAVSVQVSGSGITLNTPLTKIHDNGTQVASGVPTPGAPNQYVRKP